MTSILSNAKPAPRRSGSDSSAQRNAEKIALIWVQQELGLAKLSEQKRFDIGTSTVIVDGFSESSEEIVLVEVNARVGIRMKTATKNKVLKDTLKLVLIERTRADLWPNKRVRKILVFLDAVALDSFGPKAWAKQAWLAFGIDTLVCPISEEVLRGLLEAQARQDLLRNEQ